MSSDEFEDDFDFDIDDEEEEFQFDNTDYEHDPKDVEEIDKEFLKSIEEKTEDSKCEEDYNVYTYFFLIIILIFFVFLIALGATYIARGHKRRNEYREVGYIT